MSSLNFLDDAKWVTHALLAALSLKICEIAHSSTKNLKVQTLAVVIYEDAILRVRI
jgi:hypothetical protein